MIIKGTKVTCDVCGKTVFVEDGKEDPTKGWMKGTEIGDLCSVCALQWGDWKTTFVTKIRKETKGDVVDYGKVR